MDLIETNCENMRKIYPRAKISPNKYNGIHAKSEDYTSNLLSTHKSFQLHNEELHNLYSSPDIMMMMIKSRRMIWARHVARIGI
jgi:hypothetical protein